MVLPEPNPAYQGLNLSPAATPSASASRWPGDTVQCSHGRQRMTSQRNYIEELAVRVEAGKKAGQSLSEIQKSMPVASIKALQADGYGALVQMGRDAAAMQAAVNTNIEHVFNRLGQS